MRTGGHLYPTPWARAWEQIDADFEAHLGEIRRFLRRPTVSASDDDMLAGAEDVATLIEGAGGSAEILSTAGHPAVLGRIEGDGPRLLRYAMYDVQPADEPGWSSPPFAAVRVEVPGVGPNIVARGAANSKGALAAFLLALASVRKVSNLPAEIVLPVDGEEGLGSPHLPGVMAARRDHLAAEAAFDLDLTADRRGVAEVYLGCKGIVSFFLNCSGGEWGGPVGRALHSSEGPVISSPAWSLVRALASLLYEARERLAGGLRRPFAQREELGGAVTSCGSLGHINFETEGEIRKYSQPNLDSPVMAAFHLAALDEGVYFAPRCFMNTSTAMDEQVIDDVLERVLVRWRAW